MNQPRVERNARTDGFSLIELMVVITIIGILASVVVMNLGDRSDQAKQTRVKADFAAIGETCSLFRLDHGRYPDGIDELMNGPVHPSTGEPTSYLDKIPNDPWTMEEYIWDVDDRNRPFFTSYGLDMSEGGEGFNQDIVSNEDSRGGR